MARKKIIETYGSTSQRVAGWVMLAIVGAFVVDIIVQWAGREAWIPFTVAVFFGVLAWITSVRPLVVAYEDTLQVRNFLKTADLEWASIDRAEMHGDLTIYPVDEQHRLIKAIAVSARRPDGSKGLAGMRNLFAGGTNQNAEVRTPLDAADAMRGPGERRPSNAQPVNTVRPLKGDHAKANYCVERLTTMMTNAKETTPENVSWQVRWSMPECVALGAASLLLLLAIIFR